MRKLIKGQNDLKTWCDNNPNRGNRLKDEWVGKLEDGTDIEMDEISYGSNKYVYWKCENNHKWTSPVKKRTTQLYNCPLCAMLHGGTSYAEQFIYHAIKQIYPNAVNRCIVLRTKDKPKGYEYDIGIPDIRTCIEYSPTIWHEGKEEYDLVKKKLCEIYNIRFINIVEDSDNKLEHLFTDDYICFQMDYGNQDKDLIPIVDHVLKSFGHSISGIDIEQVKKEAHEASINAKTKNKPTKPPIP